MTADRQRGRLLVRAIHPEAGAAANTREAELARTAAWLDLDHAVLP